MQARLILVILQILSSPKGRGLLVGLLILLLMPVALVTGAMHVLMPMASDDHLQDYQDVADGMPVPVDWKAMMAVDAVRHHQDFSQVDLLQIADTAADFMACSNVQDEHVFAFDATTAGESSTYPVVLTHDSDVWWEVEVSQGSASVDFQTSDGQPAGSGHNPAGGYRLIVTADAVPAAGFVTLHVESVVCHGKPLEETLDDLGLNADERAMVLGLINSFNDPGPMPFTPHPDCIYAWPVNGLITSFFGPRIDPVDGGWRPHFGVDIAAPESTPVYGAAVGFVTFAGQHPTLGNVVRVQHDGFETVYAHLKWIFVTQGEQVTKGEEIGAVGSTGKSTGPHLHFEWWVDGEATDPLYFYR